MKLGIKDGKIFDICSELSYKRGDSNIPDEDYLDFPIGDWFIGDTWDFNNNISLKDSPKRFEEPPKSELELVKERISEIEKKLKMK